MHTYNFNQIQLGVSGPNVCVTHALLATTRRSHNFVRSRRCRRRPPVRDAADADDDHVAPVTTRRRRCRSK